MTPQTSRSIRRSLVGGSFVTGLLVLGVGGWAALASFSGAVIASGHLVVESNIKKVQHPHGGVVAQLFVREGSYVRAGDVVIRLDDTMNRASYGAIVKMMDELNARQARLIAERDDLADITIPGTSGSARLEALYSEESRLFRIRSAARQGQKKQLAERIAQLREQTLGLRDQIEAKRKEISLIETELDGVRELWKRNLVPIQRVTALERDAARLEGERGALTSSVSQAHGRVAEIELQIIQVDQDMRAEVGRELAEIRGRLVELGERKIAAEDQLERIEIKAPADGFVHQLTVHTIGGVISSSEPVMLIVPQSDELRAEIRIMPQDIDSVRIGQNAIVRFPAFNRRTTPELNGQIILVSADVTHDQKTGQAYYVTRIGIAREELARLRGLKLAPGMPVETYVLTDERTVVSFLTKPITDHLNRALRER